jgi:hypothetical protein
VQAHRSSYDSLIHRNLSAEEAMLIMCALGADAGPRLRIDFRLIFYSELDRVWPPNISAQRRATAS